MEELEKNTCSKDCESSDKLFDELGVDTNMPDCELREMPRYECHKMVWALKIKSILLDSDVAKITNRETTGGARITPEESDYSPFEVNSDYMKKHNPQVGGYYVVYKDGYQSFSPADVFESGYTLITNYS